MRRNGVIRLGGTAAGCAALALLLLSGCGGAGGGGRAPACLPSTLEHDATLPRTAVSVSPAPGTGTASALTQISFLGAPPGSISEVSVRGSRSGAHEGRLQPYSQGDGASFLPERPFSAGERVTVHARVGGRPAEFSFSVATPYPTATVGPFPNPPASPAEYESFRTEPGTQAPVLNVTLPDRDPAAGDIFMTNGPGPGSYGALIYTPQGRLVWFHQMPAGLNAEDLNVQSYEGRRDLTFWQGKVLSLGFGQGEDVVMDSSYRLITTVRGGNGLKADLHDFQIAPGHIAYITAFNPVRCDLSPAGGPRDGVIIDTAVQQIDMRSGLVRWEWHSLDHVAVQEAENSAPANTPWDWFHLNSIDPLSNGDIFISARSTWAGYLLQRGSGRILWRLGGNKSSFKLGPGAKTAWQHDGRMLNGKEVTFFDNGSNPLVHHKSRAVRIALDFATHRATLRSSFTHPSALLSASQGNVQTLASGNTVVGYGLIAAISEYSPSGALLFDAHMPLDEASYRAFRFPWQGRPSSPPAVEANLNNTGEETLVRASWNGATEVASWRVLAGDRPDALSARATVPSAGFESSAIVPAPYRYAAVQALSSSGQVLGTSRTEPVGSYAASFPGTASR